MSRSRTVFRCRACRASSPRWEGRCPACAQWNTLEPHTARPAREGGGFGDGLTDEIVEPLGSVASRGASRLPTGFGDVDRVLGGGLVRGSVILLGGPPGIGKSTLLLQLAGALCERDHRVLYVSGEESAGQVAMRADRLGTGSTVDFLATGDLDAILAAMDGAKPTILCVDSIQTVSTPSLGSPAGGVTQVRASAAALQAAAKARDAVAVLVGHVTKGGALAGPRTLEHLVDVVLHFEGERSGEHRILRGSKNRFGGVDELAAFRMSGSGLRPVDDPSRLFRSDGLAESGGTALAVPLLGTRPLLAEVQALVARARFASPQRISTGFPPRRLAILLAVLDQKGGVGVGDQDVFLNVVGGLRMSDPAVDLAVVGALCSAAAGRPLSTVTAFVGEVGLGGEVRAVSAGESRVAACLAAGIETVVAPAGLRREVSADTGVRFIDHIRHVPDFLAIGEER